MLNVKYKRRKNEVVTFVQNILYVSTFIKEIAPKYWSISAVHSIAGAVESVLPVIFFEQIAFWASNREGYSKYHGIFLCLFFLAMTIISKIFINKSVFAMDDCITEARAGLQKELHQKLFDIDYETIESEDFWRENRYILHMADTSKTGIGAVMQQCFALQGLIISLFLTWLMMIRLHIIGCTLLLMLILVYIIKNEIALEKDSIARQDTIDRSANYIMGIANSTKYAKEIRVLREWGILKKKLESLFERTYHLGKELCHKKFVQRYLVEHILYFVFSAIYMISVYEAFRDKRLDFSSILTAFFLIFTVGNIVFKLTENIVLLVKNTYGIHRLVKRIHKDENENKKENQENKVEDEIVWEFKNVSYCYPNRRDYAIKNVSFKIKKGEKIAIVGLNGAGKSTLIKCMTGLYKNYSGCILHHGDDKNIGVLFQDADVYPFTIEENVAGGDPLIEHERVSRALEQVGLLKKFEKEQVSLTEYIDKLFSETGIELSGGENKKLLLARILYKNPEMVLLDEPTSSLDVCAQKKILMLILNLLKDKTVIVVTHKMEILAYFDRILVMDNGALAEDGNWDDLIKNKGKLYRLRTMQENKI